MYHLLLVVCLANGLFYSGVKSEQRCSSPQYTALGKSGTIYCSFERDFFSVLWYNTTDLSRNDPIIYYRNETKTGAGYTSGEYDVYPNGSLIINEVLLEHQRIFVAARVHFDGEEPSLTYVQVIVVENVFSTEQSNPSTTPRRILLAIIIVVVLLFLSLIVVVVIYKYHQKRDQANCQTENLQEITSMLQTVNPIDDIRSDIKDKFLKQLKEKYKDLYDAVQPIPYIKDRLYCFDKVFIESQVELFVPMGEVEEGKGKWRKMKSYQDVFGNPRTKLPMCILEGDPGYGKSTVTLQFAYDWCNSNSTSALNDVDILILLQLRHLSGVTSIYTAIKQFILPLHSSFSVSDIRNIIMESNSVVLLLDGFDEYPDSHTTSDINNIVAKNMFQEFEVILTTTSTCLPNVYPSSTKRLRLTEFDSNARRYYIRKAVVGNDDELVQKLKKCLQDNLILNELCKVPPFFVILAHMAYENEQFQKLNSATGCFRYMISCLHSHSKNKMKNKDISNYATFVIEHLELDKVAFEALKSGKILWQKKELQQQIGREFYEQYVLTGILVEEEVVDACDDPGTTTAQDVRYKTEVRFYHRFFCEWYAAHYLSDYIEANPDVDMNVFLQHINPYDVQYTYRFACGLNPNCTKKIADYLKDIEGGEVFVILCILEQTGRFDQIGHAVREICSEGVVISSHDSLLLQRSSIQLIDLAARNGITTEKLVLHDCLQSIDLSAGAIRIHANVALTSRISVKWLSIHLHSRELSEEEAIAILKFISKCPSLNHLSYVGCVLPRSFKNGSLLSSLELKNVKVSWTWRDKEPTYNLNFHSGRWEEENDGTEPREEDFERMLLNNTKERKEWTKEKHTASVERIRGQLRKDAEKRQSAG